MPQRRCSPDLDGGEGKAWRRKPMTLRRPSTGQAEIMNQTLTGKLPTGWDAIDKAQLAKVIWGIFSTHIAPEVAQKLTSKVSGPPGATRELNLVLNGDLKGAGISFAAQF